MKEDVVMTKCRLTETCIFFNDEMENKPDIITKSFKQRFCYGSYMSCARWQVYDAIGRENVPRDLYPNQDERVKGIIEAAVKPPK